MTPISFCAATCAMAVHLAAPAPGAHLAARPPEARPCQVTLAALRHNALKAAAARLSSAPRRWPPAWLGTAAIPLPTAAVRQTGLNEIIAREDRAAAAASGAYRAFAARRLETGRCCAADGRIARR